MKKGWPQNLDNGVMNRPTKPDTGNRTSRSMDFKAIIGEGENTNGQTSITPAEVSRGGQTAGRGYDCWKWGGNTDSKRWNSNPMLNEGDGYSSMSMIPAIGVSKKKK
jgi:hypothetical protein